MVLIILRPIVAGLEKWKLTFAKLRVTRFDRSRIVVKNINLQQKIKGERDYCRGSPA